MRSKSSHNFEELQLFDCDYVVMWNFDWTHIGKSPEQEKKPQHWYRFQRRLE